MFSRCPSGISVDSFEGPLQQKYYEIVHIPKEESFVFRFHEIGKRFIYAQCQAVTI